MPSLKYSLGMLHPAANRHPKATHQWLLGGGCFKNRKPIGELGCCESGMQSESTDGPKGA